MVWLGAYLAHANYPPRPETTPITNYGYFGPIWMEFGREVKFRLTNSILVCRMAGAVFSPPHLETDPLTHFGNFGLIWMKLIL